jgi:hypothetical protein
MKRILSTVLLSVLTFVSLLGHTAFADEPSPRFAATFTDEIRGRHVASPGDVVQGTMQIRNVDDHRAITIANELQDSGNWVRIPYDWFNIDPQRVGPVEPLDTKPFSYTITIPEDAGLGIFRVNMLSVLVSFDDGQGGQIAVRVASSNAVFLEIVAPVVCEDGEVRNPATNQCEPIPPVCEDDEVLNPDNNQCEPVPPVCEDDEVLNPDNNQCEPVPPVCEDDEVLNPDNNQCEPVPPVCPEGQFLNPNNNQCEDVPYVYGDMNLDGQITMVDVDCYVDIFVNENQNEDCRLAEMERVDLTCSGEIDLFDVDGIIVRNLEDRFPRSIDGNFDLIPDCGVDGEVDGGAVEAPEQPEPAVDPEPAPEPEIPEAPEQPQPDNGLVDEPIILLDFPVKSYESDLPTYSQPADLSPYIKASLFDQPAAQKSSSEPSAAKSSSIKKTYSNWSVDGKKSSIFEVPVTKKTSVPKPSSTFTKYTPTSKSNQSIKAPATKKASGWTIIK